MAPTATPAASLANQQDPYAKYGGSVSADPYAKYGGAAIAQPPAQNQAASQPSQATPASPIRLGPLGPMAQDAAGLEAAQKEYPNATSPRTIGAVAGSIVLPGAAPEAGWLAHAALTGLGGGLGTSAGQLAEGKNPLETPNLEESGTNAALFGLCQMFSSAHCRPSRNRSSVAVSSTNQSAQPAEM